MKMLLFGDENMSKRRLLLFVSSCIMIVLLLSTIPLSANSISNCFKTGLKSEKYSFSDLPEPVFETLFSSKSKPVEINDTTSDLYTITTFNNDGTSSLYSFGTPIKYIEEDTIRIKKNLIKTSNRNNYAYEITDNDIKTYFPESIENQISIEYDNYGLYFSPENVTGKAMYYNNSVSYKHNDNISYRYSALIGGLKEEIVINEYAEDFILSFELKMDGLFPAFNIGETIPLLEKKTGTPKLIIGQVVISDSSGKSVSFNNRLNIEKTGDDTYRLILDLDKDYLKSMDTIYPVIVDPTITIASSSLSDAPVFSGKPSINYYTNEYNVVGYHGSTYGEGETFVKINTNLIGSFMHINPEKILTAEYRVYEGSGKTSNATIKVYDTDTTWTDSTITYSNKPGIINTPMPSMNINSSGWYYFSIRPLFVSWLRNELGESNGFSANYGFCLKALSTGQSSRVFCSANNSSYPPSVIITYNEDNTLSEGAYYIRNLSSNKALDVTGGSMASGTNIQQYISNNSRSQQWWVEMVSEGIYEIIPANNSNLRLDVSGGVNNDGQNIQVYSMNNTNAQKWRIIKNDDNSFRIISTLGYFHSVEVENSSINNGANVQLYSYYGYSNQKWSFEKIEPSIVTRTAWNAGPFVPKEGDPGNIYINNVLIPNPTHSQLADFYNTIVIHHSSRDQYEQINSLQLYDKIIQNFSDIGYHFVINGDGTIFEGRPINKNGAHVIGQNSHKIGICLMGHMDSSWDTSGSVHPTSEQIESLQDLIAWLDYEYGIDEVKKHKDLDANTICPGNYAEQDLANKYIFRYLY